MKAFRFRLQAVLTLREQSERMAQQACARAYSAVEIAAGRLRAAELALADCNESRRRKLLAGTTAIDLEHMRIYGTLLEEHRGRMARELAEAQHRAELAWRELVVATQKREALERLRTRQRRAYEYRASRTEQKMLDDLAGRGSVLTESWRNPPVIV